MREIGQSRCVKYTVTMEDITENETEENSDGMKDTSKIERKERVTRLSLKKDRPNETNHDSNQSNGSDEIENDDQRKSTAAILASLSDKQQVVFYMHHPTDRTAHTMAFDEPVVDHWLEQIITLHTVTKQLKMLSFVNPGKFMDNFDPERSAREMRKMNRKIYRDKVRANQLYDNNGKLLENSQDLCDCLDIKCPGCHFPCPKCGSEKCGSECRCYRRWTYDYVEVEGTNCVIQWPNK